jgi:hypothetical protein
VNKCQRCGGDGEHDTWMQCQAEMAREDLRSPARYARPRKKVSQRRRDEEK